MKESGNIILIGFMGTGKTRISAALQELTGMPFLDTDEEIAREAGKDVRSIFAEDGENAFRDRETKLLERLLVSGWKGILSTGGGMPVRPENRILLKKLGTVVYLRSASETILQRLEGDTSRPLLNGLPDRNAKLEKIREMLNQRDPVYTDAAQICVDTDGRKPGEIAVTICNRIAG